VAFSRDGQSLATVSPEGKVTISDTADGKDRLNLQDPGGSLSDVSFSPNGAYLLTVSTKNRTVRLWSINAGREMALLTVPTDGKVESAATRATFDLQGTHVALVSGDKVARIVRVFPTTQSLIDYANGLVPRNLTPCERKRFFLPTPDNIGICPN
jgi:WD40 repeat protein